MAPLCFARAYFAQEILIKFPRLIYPLILLGVVYGIYVIKAIRQLAKQGAANRAAALAVEQGREG
jgi:NhaP-type Na+/H+ or K+/H+ antiporter